MGLSALESLLAMLDTLSWALTAPGFRNFVVLFVGWVQTQGVHAVTSALVETDVARRAHHERFHRFFSRGTWCPDEIGRLLFAPLLRLLPPGAPIRVVLDDTLAPKKGPHIFGLGSHLDAVRSTKRFRVLTFGHCWVVMAILVPLPFSRRTWALPLLFRLYRNEKECLKRRERFHKKTELAREMLDVVVGWADGRAIELAADNAYCNDTVLRNLSATITFFGAMRPDAVLTAPPRVRKGKHVGRPPVRGRLLPKPAKLAEDKRHPWSTCKAMLYGKQETVSYKELTAQWYRAAGARLLRIIVVKVETGSIGMRVFFCTDPTLPVARVLESYAGRWAIEVCFRELKQLLGFADSSARKRAAVERTAPFVGYVYTVLVLWFATLASQRAVVPVRPWYRHKAGYSFADVLRTAQHALAPLDVLDPARSLANLQQPRRTQPSRSASPLKRVA